MDFSQLKADVNTYFGRDDMPDAIYRLATSGINRDTEFLDTQKSVQLVLTSAQVPLPADFQRVISASIDLQGQKWPLEATTDQSVNLQYRERWPRYYAIRASATVPGGNEIVFSPEPEGEYTVDLQYTAKLADLVNPTDTNAVLSRYPGLYLYQALTHAAIWAKDAESQQSYGAAYASELNTARSDDKNRRLSTGIAQRSRRL